MEMSHFQEEIAQNQVPRGRALKYATEAERKQARYEAQKRWRAKNRERYNAYTREYLQRQRADPEKRKAMNLLKRMWRKVKAKLEPTANLSAIPSIVGTSGSLP